MKREISGSRVIVTGASSGIGRALVVELCRGGAKVVAVARRAERLAELAAHVCQSGGVVETLSGDITDPAVRQQAVERSVERFGGLDILVNNAGVGAMGLFEEATAERLRRVMEVNFFALVEMTRLALPLLKQGRRPIVVNVGSILGHRGVPHSSEYAASKFAVHGFSESLRTNYPSTASTCWWSAPARPKPSSSTASSSGPAPRNGPNTSPFRQRRSRGRPLPPSAAAGRNHPLLLGQGARLAEPALAAANGPHHAAVCVMSRPCPL